MEADIWLGCVGWITGGAEDERGVYGGHGEERVLGISKVSDWLLSGGFGGAIGNECAHGVKGGVRGHGLDSIGEAVLEVGFGVGVVWEGRGRGDLGDCDGGGGDDGRIVGSRRGGGRS